MAADFAGQLVAIHDRHVAVGDDHVERRRQPGLQALCAIPGLGNLVAEIAQLFFQQHEVGRVVVHHQDSQHGGIVRQRWVGHCLRGLGWRGQG
ncbi:hypothetical protein D3C81_1967330 [compost metagenome]